MSRVNYNEATANFRSVVGKIWSENGFFDDLLGHFSTEFHEMSMRSSHTKYLQAHVVLTRYD